MSVASKNLFELLGNDDGDSDTPKGPVKTVDKTSLRSTKRGVEPEAPKAAATTGVRRGGFTSTGSEAAFRDRNVGADRNRGKSTDEGARGGRGGGIGARVRGGRGSRFPRDRDDRHTKGGATGSEKQASLSWGANEGNAERKDEQAGEAIAQAEQKEAAVEGDAIEGDKAEAGEPEEPEEKQVSYTEYLAQQAEKKAALDAGLEVRKPNEGSKLDKKWANAKALVKDEAEDLFPGSGGKAKRERERKTKQLVDIDQRFVEPERTERGGGARGGRGRGAPRGDGGRGRGAPRGDGGRGRGRGDSSFRGDRGDRGGRRENAAPVNTSDKSAFPALGS